VLWILESEIVSPRANFNEEGLHVDTRVTAGFVFMWVFFLSMVPLWDLIADAAFVHVFGSVNMLIAENRVLNVEVNDKDSLLHGDQARDKHYA
jgi:hypothetical protein